MLDLRTQLRSYVDETVERINVDDVMSAVSSRPLVAQQRSSFRRPAVAFVVAAIVVLAVIGGTTWLVRGGAVGPAADPTPPITTQAPEPDSKGLGWHQVGEAPAIETVRALVPGCCWNVILGADSWARSHGPSFTGPGAQPIPVEIGPLRSIAASGVEEIVAVPDSGPTVTPYVVAQQITGTAATPAWTTEALPTDVPSPHPDVVMHYTVRSVTYGQGARSSFVVYGLAHPDIDPEAITREYPELGPVVRTALLAPCCDGVPLTTEIADPLWVWTGDPSSEPTAISLGAFGLTRDDLRGGTGVVWVFDRPSGPRPWVATTALIADDVGPEFFFESGAGGGFVLLTERSGGYDTWSSPSGVNWTSAEAVPGHPADLTVWKGRTLVLTTGGTILELQQDNTWGTLADAGTFDLPGGEPADPTRIEAGDVGIVVVGEREKVLPWSDGEPIPTAQVLWFSPDGAAWRHQELSGIFGDIGAVEILVTRHEGHRDVPPTVVAAFAAGQANGEPLTDPQWWEARTS